MDNKFIGLVIGLVIGVLLIATLMAPTISDIQKTAGDKVIKTNGGNNPLLLDYYDDDFTMVYEDGTITIGDASLDRSSSTDYRIMYWEYGRVTLSRTSQATAIYINDYRTSSTAISINYNMSINYDASEKTLTVIKTSDESTVTTITAETVMTIKNGGSYVYLPTSGIGSSYYTTDLIKTGSYGYLDTSITYGDYTLEVVSNKNGISVFGLPEGTEYTASLDVVGGSVVDGTTDIYSGGVPTFTIKIGDDTITDNSYRFGQVVLKDVAGHADSGAAYSLYGVFVVLFIVAVLMFAVRFVINRD